MEKFLKVVLKQPIGGMIRDGVASRASMYLLCKGGLTTETLERMAKEDWGWLFLVDVQGNMVYIPVENVAFIQEVSDDPALHRS